LTQERARHRDGDYVAPAGLGALMRSGWRDFWAHRTTLVGLFAMASAAVIITTVAANLISYAAGRPLIVVVLLEQIVPFFAIGVLFGFGMAAGATVLSREDGPGLRDALRSTRLPAKDLLTSGLLAGMVMVTAVTLLYLPLLFLPLFFGPPILVHVIALDRIPFSAAATRTREILTGEKLRAVGALLPAAFLTGTLMYAAPNAVAAAADPLGVVVKQAAAIITRVAIDAIAVGFFAAVAYALFVDIRARRTDAPPEPRGEPRPETASQPSRNRKKKKG
jgi:hypothetical protein